MTYTPDQRLFNATILGITVDPEDEWLLREFAWSFTGGYPRAELPRMYGRKVNVGLAQCIVGAPIWENETIDHYPDKWTGNCTRSNLRIVPHSINAKNRSTSSVIHRKLLSNGTYRMYLDMGTFDTQEEGYAEAEQ